MKIMLTCLHCMPFIETLPSIRNISSILQENMGQPSSLVVLLFSNKCILSSFIFKCFLIKTLLTLGNIIQKWIPSALSSSIAKENNFDHMLQNVCSYVRLETLTIFICAMGGSSSAGLWAEKRRVVLLSPKWDGSSAMTACTTSVIW